jgi:beta-lactamase regulating signal transducer with metallopeptidase domain
MDTLLHVGLSNAALATALALSAAIASRFCRRPALAHSLWLLVLLKLLTPPLWRVPLPWPAPVPEPTVAAPVLPVIPGDGTAKVPELPPLLEADTGEPLESPSPVPPAIVPQPVLWKSVVLSVWLLGSLGWWTVAGLRLGRFRRLLRAVHPAPADVQEQARRLAGLLGLKHCPGVWFVPAAVSPMLLALGRSPCLLLPAGLWGRLSTEQRDTLLAHELAHVRRGDPWVRRLELVVLGLYWWHPVAWWARRALQEAEEQCCDAWVVWALPDAALDYAAALVETVAFLSRTGSALPVGASGTGPVPLLKRRLTRMPLS